MNTETLKGMSKKELKQRLQNAFDIIGNQKLEIEQTRMSLSELTIEVERLVDDMDSVVQECNSKDAEIEHLYQRIEDNSAANKYTMPDMEFYIKDKERLENRIIELEKYLAIYTESDNQLSDTFNALSVTFKKRSTSLKDATK